MSTETNDPAELRLNAQERHSTAWLKVRAFLVARIDEHRRQNDNDLTPEKTAHTRGRIAELKNLLAAGDSQDQQ